MSNLTSVLWLVCLLLMLCPAFPAQAATAPAPAKREWLVMLYQNADDPVLEGDIFTDLNEAKRVGANDAATMLVKLSPIMIQ